MSESNAHETSYDFMDCLIFQFDNALMGIDSEQIAEICDNDKARENEMKVVSLKALFPQFVKERHVETKVLIVRYDGISAGIGTGMPSELVTLPVSSIMVLPDVFKKFSAIIPVWGVTVLDDKTVLLVDIIKSIRLFTEKNK